MIYTLAVFATIVAIISGDVYMHMPRGSNNRLNEQAAQRNNANRLFDSQNNNRGGYNVGDMDPVNGFEEATYMATFAQTYDFRFLSQAGDLEKQYEELFFENSNISITWTNQHGAGNKNSDSMIVLQFICDTFPRPTSAGTDGAIGPGGTASTTQLTTIRKHGLRTELMNGGNTNTPNEPTDIQTNANCNLESTYQGNNDGNFGRRESEDFYCLCKSRQRNKGLFTADQILAGDDERYTRQNPNGNRRGLECPEERDYYPWWHPTPFHDIAVITPDVNYCNEYIAPESQNTKAKYHCVRGTVTGNDPSQWLPAATYVEYNLNQTGCTANGGSWEGFKWGFTDSSYNPECVDSYWSRYNHLGNVDNTKRGGKMAHYDWQLPSFDDLTGGHMCYSYAESITTSDTVGSDFPTATVSVNCVRMMVRLRYNISTMDYDPYKTNSSMNDDTNDGVISPVQQNPTVDVGAFTQGLRLAINTAQTGRTFQDNSHTFRVCEYPANSDWSTTDLLLNVMVRGKRGNIVQTFPAIEYDFEPQYISVKPGQCLHFQWTGSNTHNNGNPAGDGQAGDAGEGRGGSDRSNLVQMLAMDQSYPLTYDKAQTDFFDYVTCYHPLFPSIDVSSVDAQLILGTGGFYRSKTQATTRIADDGEDSVMDELMNNVSASFRQGLICCVDTDSDLNGTLEVGDIEIAFLSTRNNNFTNRSQKLKIVLSKSPESPSLW